MKKQAILLCLTLGFASSGLAAERPAGDAAAGKNEAATCVACHGEDGNGPAPFPKLAGQGERYLYKQLQDIRDGVRVVPTMIGQVDDKTDQELADIAAYFSSQETSGGQTDPALLE
ncbi:MAG: cytochrome c, partial [Halieaceae bacterium]|nr:cytochrome c [Halieaceae bacterium]